MNPILQLTLYFQNQQFIQKIQNIQNQEMDISNIEEQLEILSTIGYTLTVEQRLRLKMARTTILNNNPEEDQVKFWGKIEALTNTYYILVSLRFNQSYQFPHKRFFYSLNNFQFKELPQLLLQHDSLVANFNNQLFSGDAAKILVNLQGQGGQEAPPAAQQGQQGQQGQKKQNKDDQQDQDIKKAPKKNFTQLNRLSFVVRSIQNDAQIVPRDSFRMSPQHELHLNNKFYGLTKQNALNYGSWLHFKSPQTVEARQNIQQDTVIFNSNFLDNLESDLPKGVWSLQLDHQQKSVNVRNLFWIGYYAYHRLNSNVFGSVYIGDGIKNVDLPFMI